MTRPTSLEDELRAAAAASRELGGDYESVVLRSFLERLDQEIDRRIAARTPTPRRTAGIGFTGLVLALASIGMGLGVPSAMSGHFGGGLTFVLTLVAWAAIAAINIAYAHGAQRRR
jgi:hypothetical protein